MSPSCADFREHLAGVLEGRTQGGSMPLEALAWHEHLAQCAECSDLLDSEQALEALLTSLPKPRLAPELARRVLLRLEHERTQEARLEELLDLDRAAEPAPPGLAARVLAALESQRADPALDALLAAVPAPEAPPGLAARVLAGLEERRLHPGLDELLETVPAPRAPAALARRVLAGLSRERARSRRPWRVVQPLLVRLAASLLLLAGGGYAIWRAVEPAAAPAPVELARVETPPEGLLEHLDLLESWELITSDDLDILLASLDSFDQELLLLEMESEESREVLRSPPAPEDRNG